MMVQGELPPVEVALDLYNILSKSDTDLRQPVGLEKQLLKDNDLDSDVAKSMLQLLKVLLDAISGLHVMCSDRSIWLLCLICELCFHTSFWVSRVAARLYRH